MAINKTKRLRQLEAVKAWNKNKFNTVLMHTGTGKTWVFFDSLLKTKCNHVLILAETTVREETILDDRQKYITFFGKDPFENRQVQFMCYHSLKNYIIPKEVKKKKLFIFCDEVHELITPSRFPYLKRLDSNKFHFLGLTATLDKLGLFTIGEETLTKFQFLDSYAPICYEYHIEDAKVDNTTRDLIVITYEHKLDTRFNIEKKTKKQEWITSEMKQNTYLDDAVRKAMFLPESNSEKPFLKTFWTATRMRFLHSLPSKIVACKHLLNILPGRTIVFAYDSDTLMKLGIPAIVVENKNYKQDLQRFINGEINQIGTNKILLQGANLGKVDNMVNLSYDSKEGKTKQKAGRLRQDLSFGRVIIFKTLNTQEAKWYESMVQPLLVFPQKTINNISEITKYL